MKRLKTVDGNSHLSRKNRKTFTANKGSVTTATSDNLDDEFELPQMHTQSIATDRHGETKKTWNWETTTCQQSQSKNLLESIPFVGTPSAGRTISVALPASIITNAQSFELRSYLVGQIARTLVVYGVHDVVVFEDHASAVAQGSPCSLTYTLLAYDKEIIKDRSKEDPDVEEQTEDGSDPSPSDTSETAADDDGYDSDDGGATAAAAVDDDDSDDDDNVVVSDLPCSAEDFDDRKSSSALQFFVINLCYLETPQYLRKALFRMNPSLRMAGLQNPLDAPHHMRYNEWLPYRDGITVAKSRYPAINRLKFSETEIFTFVDCGLPLPVRVPGHYNVGIRVTVRLDPSGEAKCFDKQSLRKQKGAKGKRFRNYLYIGGSIVPRTEPEDIHGIYWGYQVRAASSLKEVLKRCPYDSNGFDLIIGTSEKGDSVNPTTFELVNPNFKHCLIVFGGLTGIEGCIEDEQSELPLVDPKTLFQQYLNICVNQRSRTIRAEEALAATLAVLRPYLIF